MISMGCCGGLRHAAIIGGRPPLLSAVFSPIDLFFQLWFVSRRSAFVDPILLLAMNSDKPNGNGPCNDLTIKEAAAIVGMHWMWLYRRIGKRGGPPFKRRGRSIKIPREEFHKWNEQKIIP